MTIDDKNYINSAGQFTKILHCKNPVFEEGCPQESSLKTISYILESTFNALKCT